MIHDPSHHDIIERLKAQAASASPLADRGFSGWWHDPDSYLLPPASDELITATEAELGFALPPLLKTIYREVGNGGQLLGPGLFGLPGGYDTKNGQNIVSSSRAMASMLAWWEQFVVICDRGCSMCSCIDCTDDDFAVYRWDGNTLDEQTAVDEPNDDIWELEANTFDEWIVEEVQAFESKIDSSVQPAGPQSYNRKRRWWQFW
ncbi:SMI1 / KNR4 family protein [Symmachiella dynata]|uniref:SMI1 / KNR4 family protein n=1 Tax=Symmachiella dynata TaxID=2527995 RepID=A0A517ZRZ2_9PLAN|nr:SMI1/KNR4 family protein [Symmachiella dynata]QDU45266.1 SMI1 / KNR4 family protein [Symmachiella dynata]